MFFERGRLRNARNSNVCAGSTSPTQPACYNWVKIPAPLVHPRTRRLPTHWQSLTPLKRVGTTVLEGRSCMHSAKPHPLAPEPSARQDDHQAILKWLTDAHFTVDGSWRFLEVSPRATEFLGFSEAALLGRVLWDVFPVSLGTLFERESRAAMESRQPRRFEGYSLEHLGLSANVLFYPDPRGLCVFYRDITERERARATLEQRVAERTAEAQQLADQLRALAAELLRVEHRERRRLALLLHDHVQQLLVAAKMQVEAIGRGMNPGPVISAARRASSILRDALVASRTLSVELSPPVLHQSGLA
ncbi:MAG: PAS domain S-box protein, partial [Acidobacteria bacterium]